MAWYQLVATTTVGTTSVSIISGVDDQNEIEVTAANAAVWVHAEGGGSSTAAASVAGSGCIYVPANGSVIVSGKTGYHAIQDAATARVQVAVVSKV